MIHPNIRKIILTGTSLGVSLPKNILKAMELKRGDYITYAIYHGGIFTARKLSDAEVEFLKPREILMD